MAKSRAELSCWALSGRTPSPARGLATSRLPDPRPGLGCRWSPRPVSDTLSALRAEIPGLGLRGCRKAPSPRPAECAHGPRPWPGRQAGRPQARLLPCTRTTRQHCHTPQLGADAGLGGGGLGGGGLWGGGLCGASWLPRLTSCVGRCRPGVRVPGTGAPLDSGSCQPVGRRTLLRTWGAGLGVVHTQLPEERGFPGCQERRGVSAAAGKALPRALGAAGGHSPLSAATQRQEACPEVGVVVPRRPAGRRASRDPAAGWAFHFLLLGTDGRSRSYKWVWEGSVLPVDVAQSCQGVEGVCVSFRGEDASKWGGHSHSPFLDTSATVLPVPSCLQCPQPFQGTPEGPPVLTAPPPKHGCRCIQVPLAWPSAGQWVDGERLSD